MNNSATLFGKMLVAMTGGLVDCHPIALRPGDRIQHGALFVTVRAVERSKSGGWRITYTYEYGHNGEFEMYCTDSGPLSIVKRYE